MTMDEHAELITCLAQAGAVLAPVVDELLAQAPPTDDLMVVSRLVEIMEGLCAELGPDAFGRLVDLAQQHEEDAVFQARVAGLSPQVAAPVLGVICLLQQWHRSWEDETLGPLLQRLVAENAALARLL